MSSLDLVNKLNLKTVKESDLQDNCPNFMIAADKIDIFVNSDGEISMHTIRNAHVEKFAYTESEAFDAADSMLQDLEANHQLAELVKDANGNLVHVMYWVISKCIINGIDAGHYYPSIDTLDSINDIDDSSTCYIYNALMGGYRATR